MSAVRPRTSSRPRSHQKAARATEAGWFKDEILPVAIPQQKGDAGRRSIATNRSGRTRPPRRSAALKPAFKKDGTVTAGNAPASTTAPPRSSSWPPSARARSASRRSRGSSARRPAASPPKYVLMTPVEAVRSVAQKVGWQLDEVDLFELNEAFSVQAVAVLQRARHRSGAQGQRQRRRGRARPRHRLERRARADDAALRA